MENYSILLREHDLKATPQRLAMLESIQRYGHINIDNLYEEVKKKFNSISLATVYKNLNAMTKNMLLLEVKLPNSKSVFEIAKENHSHLMCNSCGEVTDIDFLIDTNIKKVSSKYDFEIERTDIVFSGTCSKCKGL